MKQLGLYPVKHNELSLRERLHIIAKTGFDYICASASRSCALPVLTDLWQVLSGKTCH